MKMLTMTILAVVVIAVGVVEVRHFQSPSKDITTLLPKVELSR